MERRFTLLMLSLMLVFGMFAFSQDSANKPDSKFTKDQCLSCHGPYEKIIKATADFKTPNGETVTPHQYVPHADKKDIPECSNCHTPQPMPPPDKSQVAKPKDVEWCYTSCHHAYNLQPCNNCH
jgi:hypothetical protein